VSTRERTDFDARDLDYRAEIEKSIAFTGADHAFFTQAKVRPLLELARRRVGDPRELAFLDFGCGPGETERFLEGQVGSLVGVDTSAAMVDHAREQNPWATYHAIEAGDKTPMADGSVDVCFAICVLHHVPPPQRPSVMQEMARVTRPGGLIALFEHNPLNPVTRHAVAGCEFDRDAVLVTRRESRRLLRGAGLSDVAGAYIIFFTRDSPLRRQIEARLGWLPLGAQYVISARRP
jgi:SAM-dependent methyltransferase